MGWLDHVRQGGNLYIGGLAALRRHDHFKEAQISHVVSVLRYDMDPRMVDGFRHLQIEVDDMDDEDLLESLPVTNKFIGDALDNGGAVFVHCAMGKSRSATVVVAYLMKKLNVGPQEALDMLREARGVCEPNPGFWAQLDVFAKMGMPADVAALEAHPLYARWKYHCELEAARAARTAPEAGKIRFEDEHAAPAAAAPGRELKCRKCRRTLAKAQFLVPHAPRQLAQRNSPRVPPTACAHYWTEALGWMRAELERGSLAGRLECPNARCGALVGKYAWQGLQCSCGEWVVPGISLAKGRVDEAGAGGGGGGSAGIRLPPGHAAAGQGPAPEAGPEDEPEAASEDEPEPEPAEAKPAPSSETPAVPAAPAAALPVRDRDRDRRAGHL